MCGREVFDGFLVLLLVNRPGDNERLESVEVYTGVWLSGVVQVD